MSKPIIDLIWPLGSDRSIACFSFLIVSWPTGVIYTNQTNGLACSHPQLEGLLIPILERVDVERFCPIGWGELNSDDAHQADLALKKLQRDEYFAPLGRLGYKVTVNRDKLSESTEAWIWLTLTKDPALEPEYVTLQGFPDTLEAVWTFENSD